MSRSLPTTLPNLDSRQPSHSQAISHFLESFSSRQIWLQSICGCAIGLIALMCGACVVIAIDWLVILPETMRWLLSCVVYFLSLSIGWQFGLKRAFMPLSTESLAWDVEASSPVFRESLVASVGLRRPVGIANTNSSAFVDAIEQKVAQELKGIEIDTILPWGAISKHLLSLIAAVAMVLLACCIPGARFPERLARAMLPFVSFARPSTIQIAILEPNLAIRSVPSNQVLSFVIEITGGNPKRPYWRPLSRVQISTLSRVLTRWTSVKP